MEDAMPPNDELKARRLTTLGDDAYGDNVWEPDLPEVWDGIHGRRLVREER
jgi:hypothetical protein